MPTPHNLFRLNVGFMIGAPVGYSRDFPFEAPQVRLDDDLVLTSILGTARITHTAQGLLVQMRLHGVQRAECVRCLTELLQPLNIDFTELYAFSRNAITDSGLLMPDDGQINLAPLVREYMLLEVPINPICKPDCKGLCPVCGGNLNETQCDHSPEPADPRLAVLSTLLKKK
jgi:uncharacterized protein